MSAMSDKEFYHRERERQCREMAEKADDPEIRRAHEELAKLHAAFLASSPVAELRPTDA